MRPTKGDPLLSREEDVRGEVRGVGHPCRLTGCRGWSVPVRWPDGKLTWCCTKGLIQRPDRVYQINPESVGGSR